MPKPIFDPARPFGRVMHGEVPDNQDPATLPSFHQDGNYFAANKEFLSGPGATEAEPEPNVAVLGPDTLPAVDEADVASLLEHPATAKLRALPRDELIKMVMAANGPVIAGEGSSDMMVAWLIKNVVDPISAGVTKLVSTAADDPL